MTYIARNTSEEATTPALEEATDNQSVGKSFFDQLSSKSALIVGLITSVLVLCTIGFVVLLVFFV